MKSKKKLTPSDIRKRLVDYLKGSPYKNKIKSLALFGSYAKGTAKKGSDIDLLAIFKDPVGYFTLVRIQQELSRVLKQEVDLLTREALGRHIRDAILKEAILIYEK